MGGNIGCLDAVFSFHINGKGKRLSLLMYSFYHCHYFPKSIDIFLSYDHCGPSTLRLHSGSLKIEAHCRVRGQRNRRERQGSLITKVVDSEALLIKSGPFQPGVMIFKKVVFLSLRHSKADCLHQWQGRVSLVLSE